MFAELGLLQICFDLGEAQRLGKEIRKEEWIGRIVEALKGKDEETKEQTLSKLFVYCQGRLSSHLQMSAVTDIRTPPHRLLTWHGSRPKGTKGLLEGSGVRVRVQWN